MPDPVRKFLRVSLVGNKDMTSSSIKASGKNDLRRAGDVSPLILREANNQGIDIPRSPETDLIFDREQNIVHCARL